MRLGGIANITGLLLTNLVEFFHGYNTTYFQARQHVKISTPDHIDLDYLGQTG